MSTSKWNIFRSEYVRRVGRVFLAAVRALGERDAMVHAAALAFFTGLSFAPLLVILISIAGMIGTDVQGEIVDEVGALIGPNAREAIDLVLDNVEAQKLSATVPALLGVITLLFSATAVFAQLQTSMNRIWNIEVTSGHGVWIWLRKRLLSLGMVLAIGFLLLVSLGVSAALAVVLSEESLPWRIANFAVSFLVFVTVFALIFKFLPDAKIEWRDVWVGAFVTALLFGVGKSAIGTYLGYSTVGSAYGVAGSLIVLLIWVYYSSVILFFGAELTQVYAALFGSHIEPEDYADWADGDPAKTIRKRLRK